MAAINLFLNHAKDEELIRIREYAEHIGCITLPYGTDIPELKELPQAVFVSGQTLPSDLAQKHPYASAVFSNHPLDCDLPNIQCNTDGKYCCLCLSPPDQKHFTPSGLTEVWVEEAKQLLRSHSPETVTVELFAGAYDVPFPYDGSYETLSISQALALAKNHGSLLLTNKYSYYSYFIYQKENRHHIVFVATESGLKELIKRFEKLGIKRFAGHSAEFLDEAMLPLLSFFRKYP